MTRDKTLSGCMYGFTVYFTCNYNGVFFSLKKLYRTCPLCYVDLDIQVIPHGFESQLVKPKWDVNGVGGPFAQTLQPLTCSTSG